MHTAAAAHAWILKAAEDVGTVKFGSHCEQVARFHLGQGFTTPEPLLI